MRPSTPLAFLALMSLVLACSTTDTTDTAANDDSDSDSDSDADSDTDTDTDADTDTDTDADTDADSDVMVAPHVASGDVTWQLDFDASAEAAGYSDCSYSRTWEGVEFLDQPYRCPACDFMLGGEAVMYEGFDDCYSPYFGGTSDTQDEVWGFDWPDTEGGNGSFYRSNAVNYPAGLLSEIKGASLGSPVALSWHDTYTLADFGLSGSGNVTLSAAGEVTVNVDESGAISDPRGVRTEAYDCGWPLGNPGTLVTDYVLDYDHVLPRAWLEDSCGDLVDIWDFYGSYIVLDASVTDCAYCQKMASQAPAALESMRADGIPVVFVTVLGESLSDPLAEITTRTLDDWLDYFGGEADPVLKDRGFGYAIFAPFSTIYYKGSFGYPSVAVVRPDMTVIDAVPGFPGWDTIRKLIEADM